MWIKCNNTATEALSVPEIDRKIRFSGDNNTAQVIEEVGEQLIKQVDAVVEYNASTTEKEKE